MSQTYDAIFRGGQIEWVGAPPQIPDGAPIKVSVPEPPLSIEERRRRVATILEELVAADPFRDIVDPVAWQREIRKDRPLAGREDDE